MQKYLISLVWIVVIVSGLTGCEVSERPMSIEADAVELAEPNVVEVAAVEPTEPKIVEVLRSGSADPAVVTAVCELIYQGKFDAAGKLIEKKLVTVEAERTDANSVAGALVDIVQEYSVVGQRRKSAQESAYKEQLAELEAIRIAADANGIDDVNDISKALSVVAEVTEFAEPKQKEGLLSDSFVKQVIQKAKTKAAEFESQGKWLDAYTSCYFWLERIDEDNTEYSDYAEQLRDRAGIVASFQDSPCETRKERFRKVKRRMFVRAIDTLNLNYVSIVDYRQMAIESVARCRLLADVVGSSSAVRDALREKDVEYVVDDPQYREKLGAWSLALGEILDKAEQSLMGMSKDEFIDVFKEVMEVNASTIALPEPVLIAQFTDAAFSALDPYTTLIWPRQVEEFEKIMTNEFTGIGIEITKEKGLLTVASLLPDTPAYNSGLDAEDIIEAVDGVPTKDMSLMCAVRNITGPAGTKVTLTIRSAGEEQSRDITITRARITVPTIRGWLRDEIGGWLYMLDEANKIGYVRVTSFSERTSSDLDKVLGQLESEGLRGLILDLRFNTGGLLPSAVAVTNKFLEEGPIVVTRPRSWVLSSYESAHKKGTHPDYPLVILINRYSASASEIVAGALADEIHERAVLVGDRTHGKGSVQVLTTYPKEGAQLRYTMAYYHLPSGQRVESREAMEKQGRSDWGIGPDIEIKLRRDEHLKRRVVQRANDILVKAGHDNDIAPLKRYTVEEVFEADPQLAVGVLVVKAKDIERRVKNYN